MKLDFKKYPDGLIPVIVQDHMTLKVLMLGFMNKEAFNKTEKEGRVTFYSRSKNRLWTKGETSENYLDVVELIPDCDNDTLLIKARPHGPTCHTGADTCFKEENKGNFLYILEDIIKQRKQEPKEGSYTTSLFNSGINKIAQKVGEEAVEVIIEAKDDNPELFKNETADLLYHLLVLLEEKKLSLKDIEEVLRLRHK